MSLTLEVLLEKGYLPQELPPPFASQSLAKYFAGQAGGVFPFTTAAHKTSRPGSYNLARSGTLRRELSIPNPVHFSMLSDYVVKNWPALLSGATSSQFSLSAPVDNDPDRAIGRKHSLGARPVRRAEVYARGRYLLRADISRFYPSVYTHSVPWALHGKIFSKQNKNTRNLGNDIDLLLRNCQDGQTNGIPIGPDTSLLIAELLLCQVDAVLHGKGMFGLRYVDDYELVFDTEPQALEGLSLLQQALLDFELNLNPAKTKILPLPQRVEELWVEQLRSIRVNPRSAHFVGQLINFFDTAFDLASSYPEAGVLKYASGRIAGIRTWVNGYAVAEDLLIQCARVEPGSLPFVLNTLLRNPAPSQAATERRRHLLMRTIIEHAPRKHSSEVAWAVWACIAEKYQISTEALARIVGMEDSICALLALHAKSLGLAERPSDLDALQSVLVPDELYDSRWMLVYEAMTKGWLSSPSGVDFVAADANFTKLKAAGVSFYDHTKTALPPLPPIVRPKLFPPLLRPKASQPIEYDFEDLDMDEGDWESESSDYFL